MKSQRPSSCLSLATLRRTILLALLMTGTVLSSNAAFSQGLVTGIRISNLSVSTLDVDFDVTLNTSSPSDAYAYTGFLGNRFTIYTTTYTEYTSPGRGTGTIDHDSRMVRELNLPAVNGVDFGDGNVITATTIPAVTRGSAGTYVGSFSHSYAAPGSYTIRVATTQPVDPDGITTGSPVYALAGSTVSRRYQTTSNVYTQTPSGSIFSDTFTTSTTDTFTTSTKNVLVALQNTASVAVTGNLLEIPTLSSWSMLLLISLLAGGGFYLIRR